MFVTNSTDVCCINPWHFYLENNNAVLSMSPEIIQIQHKLETYQKQWYRTFVRSKLLVWWKVLPIRKPEIQSFYSCFHLKINENSFFKQVSGAVSKNSTNIIGSDTSKNSHHLIGNIWYVLGMLFSWKYMIRARNVV